jgi:Zn-finger nucleic acid-binding protein
MRDALECPNCRRQLMAPADDTVESVCCPGCGTTFRLKEPAPALPQAMFVRCPYCTHIIAIHMDFPAPFQNCPRCRATMPRGELLRLAKDAGYSVVIDSALEILEPYGRPVLPEGSESEVVSEVAQSTSETNRPVENQQGLNPIPRIEQKRSFIHRHLDSATAFTRRINRAFIIGACIPPTLSVVLCVILIFGTKEGVGNITALFCINLVFGNLFLSALTGLFLTLSLEFMISALRFLRRLFIRQKALPFGLENPLVRSRAPSSSTPVQPEVEVAGSNSLLAQLQEITNPTPDNQEPTDA